MAYPPPPGPPGPPSQGPPPLGPPGPPSQGPPPPGPPGPPSQGPPPPGPPQPTSKPEVRSLTELLKKRLEDQVCGDCGRTTYDDESPGQLPRFAPEEYHSAEKTALKLTNSVCSSSKPRKPLEQLRDHLQNSSSALEPYHANFLRRRCRHELCLHIKTKSSNEKRVLSQELLDDLLPQCKVIEYVCPTYAVFLCEACAQAHKTSDVLESEVHTIEAVDHDANVLQALWDGGNARNHEVWEEYAPAFYAVPPPSYHPRVTQEWIHAKYEKQLFKGDAHAEDFMFRMPQTAIEGFVTKQKGKAWEKVWLIHHHRWISFFKHPTDDQPEKRIDHTKAKIDIEALPSTKKEDAFDVFTFRIVYEDDKKKERTIVFRVEKFEDLMKWYHHLKRAEIFYEDPSHLPKTKKDPIVEYLSSLMIRNAALKGNLAKRAKNLRGWVDRHWTVLGPTLYYFTKDGDTKPQGLINLHNSEVHPRAKQHAADHENCFALICEERVYVLQAQDDEDRQQWIKEFRVCQMLYPRRNKINFAAKDDEDEAKPAAKPQLRELGAM